jgi:hypothetical protein
MMNDDGPRNAMLTVMLRTRRIFPYLVFFLGAVLGASAVIRVFSAVDQQQQMREMAWLGISLLLYWLAFGLLERNERSWKIYQMIGAVLTGALGLALVIITTRDIILWLTFKNLYAVEMSISWFISGAALMVWGFTLVTNNGGACLLWQIAVLPIALYSFWWWKDQVQYAITEEKIVLVVLSALYFAVSMGALLLISYIVHQRAKPKEDPKARKAWQSPRSFPSKYHELLARGRLCELFELPCEDPCPLATKIVTKYQKRRIQYRLYPEILEPFEKAYAILVTPQKRELCRVAHEILRTKEKQLGARRYQEQEIYLWKTLWNRLQDGEYMGDPQKALRDKNRLLREITPPDEQ